MFFSVLRTNYLEENNESSVIYIKNSYEEACAFVRHYVDEDLFYEEKNYQKIKIQIFCSVNGPNPYLKKEFNFDLVQHENGSFGYVDLNKIMVKEFKGLRTISL